MVVSADLFFAIMFTGIGCAGIPVSAGLRSIVRSPHCNPGIPLKRWAPLPPMAPHFLDLFRISRLLVGMFRLMNGLLNWLIDIPHGYLVIRLSANSLPYRLIIFGIFCHSITD